MSHPEEPNLPAPPESSPEGALPEKTPEELAAEALAREEALIEAQMAAIAAYEAAHPPDATPAPTVTQSPTAAPVHSGARKVGIKQIAPLAVLVMVGLIVGIATNGSPEPVAEPVEEPHEEHPAGPVHEDHEPVDFPLMVKKIDSMIQIENHRQALHAIWQIHYKSHGAFARELAYREGVCHEHFSAWTEAKAAYTRSMESKDDVLGWARSTLGLARCAAGEGDVSNARSLTLQVMLRSGASDCRRQQVLEACRYLLARADVLDLGVRPFPDPLDSSTLCWPAIKNVQSAFLDYQTVAAREELKKHPPSHEEHSTHPTDGPEHPPADAHHKAPLPIDGDHHQHTPEKPTIPEVVEVRTLSKNADQYLVTLDLRKVAPLTIMKRIAEKAGRTPRFETEFEGKLGNAPIDIEVDRMTLGELSSLLAGRAELEVKAEEQSLIVAMKTPLDKKSLAVKSLRRALDAAPGHPARNAARIALANLDHAQGRTLDAARGYRRILEDEPPSPEDVHAAFNIGMIEFQSGQMDAARRRLVEVLDRRPDSDWGPRAWNRLAWTYLYVGDTTKARSYFQKAYAKAHGVGPKKDTMASALILGLCFCDLLDENFERPAELLRVNRVGTRHVDEVMARLFDEYMRMHASPTESRKELVRRSLEEVQDLRLLGPSGVYLAGRMYQEMGQQDAMIDLYSEAVRTWRGPVMQRMALAVGERYFEMGDWPKAKSWYGSLEAVAPDSEFGIRARLRLAEIAVEEKRGVDCVNLCKSLLDQPGVDEEELLHLMGRGFELIEDYHSAARCFAGIR